MFDRKTYCDAFDAVHAPDGTVRRILSMTDSVPTRPKPKRRLALPLLAAVVLMLGISAFAAWSVHSARQQELREDLRIDENRVDGYVEYDVSSEEESGLVLLSSLNDGKTQYVYVDIAPVTEEEINLYMDKGGFFWRIDGTGLQGFADPRTPADVTFVGLDEIHAGVRQYAYEEDSRALTLVCYLDAEALSQAMAELGSDAVPLSVYIAQGERVLRSFGPAAFTPTEAQRRVFDFDGAIYHDADYNRDIELVGLELTPFNAVWKVRFQTEPSYLREDGWDEPLQDRTLMEEKVCRETKIVFSDGTEFSTGGAVGSFDADGLSSLPCGWRTAININDIVRIVLDGLVLWEKEGGINP